MTSMQVVGCTPPTAYMPNTIVQVPRPVTDYARYGNHCNNWYFTDSKFLQYVI